MARPRTDSLFFFPLNVLEMQAPTVHGKLVQSALNNGNVLCFLLFADGHSIVLTSPSLPSVKKFSEERKRCLAQWMMDGSDETESTGDG